MSDVFEVCDHEWSDAGLFQVPVARGLALGKQAPREQILVLADGLRAQLLGARRAQTTTCQGLGAQSKGSGRGDGGESGATIRSRTRVASSPLTTIYERRSEQNAFLTESLQAT